MNKIELKVLYFGLIQEKVGLPSETIYMDPGITITELKEHLYGKYPDLGSLSVKFALNQHLVDKETEIGHSGEIALLPPFAGG